MTTAEAFHDVPIEKLCTKVTTGATPLRSRSDYFESGTIDWYKTGELKDWYLPPAEERITAKALSETSAKLFPPETVLMAMYGDGRTITSLGILRRSAATNQACCAMLVDESKCDRRYFFYALKHRRHVLLNVASGGAQRNLSGKLIKEFTLPVPSLLVQRRIAGILSAYDELIENCQRRIRILETMARSLYREWFVNFRFPGHEKVRRVPSALGEIPEGWGVKAVSKILSRRAAGNVYRESDVKPEGTIPVVDQSTSELLGFHDDVPDHSATTARPIAIFGDHTCKMQLLVAPFSVGPNVVPFETNNDLPTAYVFYAVNSLVKTQEYKRHWVALNANEIVVADGNMATRFSAHIQPMLQAQESFKKIIRNLRRTRDLLLPRLLSGEMAMRSDVTDLGSIQPNLHLVDSATIAPSQLSIVAMKPAVRMLDSEGGLSEAERTLRTDDINRTDILCAIRALFNDGQARERDNAIRELADMLGYQRTGSRVYEVLSTDLQIAVRRGIIVNVGGVYRLGFRTLADCIRESLKKDFESAIGRAWITRDDAIRALARWLGFARVGAVIHETARSLINGLIREGRLETDGPVLIRRC